MSALICEILHLTQTSADIVLSALRSAVYTGPIPSLSNAAKIALEVLDIIQAKQNAQLGLNSLIRDCCGIVYAIIIKYLPTPVADTPSSGLTSVSAAVADLAEHLSAIKTFVYKEASRPYFSRALKRGSRARKAAFYHEVLEFSLPNFRIHSMCIQAALSQAQRQRAPQQPHIEAVSREEDRILRRRLEIEREERELEERYQRLRERQTALDAERQIPSIPPSQTAASSSSRPSNGGFFNRSKGFTLNGGKFYDVQGNVNTTKNTNSQYAVNSGNNYWSSGGNSSGGLTTGFSPLAIASAHHGMISAGI